METEKVVQLLPAGGWRCAYVFENQNGELGVETRPLVCWALTSDGDVQPLCYFDSLIEPISFDDLGSGFALVAPGEPITDELKQEIFAAYRKAHPARRENTRKAKNAA